MFISSLIILLHVESVNNLFSERCGAAGAGFVTGVYTGRFGYRSSTSFM